VTNGEHIDEAALHARSAGVSLWIGFAVFGVTAIPLHLLERDLLRRWSARPTVILKRQ